MLAEIVDGREDDAGRHSPIFEEDAMRDNGRSWSRRWLRLQFAGDDPGRLGIAERRAPRERRALGRELIADCESFLLGHYVDRLEARSEAVPVWAWTNLLAHGSEDAIRQAASSGRPGSGPSRRWRAAQSYLAAEVLKGSTNGSLAELQRRVLAPLEMQLATQHDVGSWSPQRWAATVGSTLNAHEALRRCGGHIAGGTVDGAGRS